jgi:hypothetical protein
MTGQAKYGVRMMVAQGLCENPHFQYVIGPVATTESPEMNAHSDFANDIAMKTDDVLRVELEVFRREHRDLDESIRALQDRGTSDQLTLQRLKKKKLLLKDRIALIEDRLTPDIIA